MPDPYKIVINAVSAQPIVLAPQVSSGQKLTILQGPITIVGTQLVPATNSILGGIIVGSNLSITSNGVLSANIPPQGVTAFNGRTGNVTLTANDVTAVANGIYIADASAVSVPVSYGNDLFYGHYQTKNRGGGFPYVSGGLLLGSNAMVGIANQFDPCNIEFWPGDIFNQMRFRAYNKSIVINNDGFSVETGTANWSWSANTILTQGRGDSRYQNAANNTWANLTGKPTLATVATSGSYNDLANTPNLSLYYLANNPTGYITASCLTYGNISGTPNLSLYLTTANAATTYLPSANFSFSNLTGKPTTLSGYGITDGLTSATAAATYQTISGMSIYLTTSSAASTYLPSVNFTYANLPGKPTFATVATSGNYNDLSNKPASYTLPAATNSTLGGVIVGANLSVSANGTLSANIPAGGGGGFANGDILNGGTF